MRRMLAITVLLALLAAAIPAHAATGKVPVSDAAQAANAVRAAKRIHNLTLASGESFSFNKTVGPRTEEAGYVPAETEAGETIVGFGCAHAATALYSALKELGSGLVSFDEICYTSDGSGLLTDYDSGRDFRFTNLAPGAMHIAFDAADGKLVCTVDIDETEAAATAMPGPGPAAAKGRAAVTLICEGDPAALGNIALAVNTVHDTTLAAGDVFSFCDVVGPATADFGYVPAPDGRGETVPGGGVNQLASALWLLIQERDDMVIVEKSTYGKAYAQTYVENSSDAILTDPASGADFAFRYTGKKSITLYAALTENILTVAFQ